MPPRTPNLRRRLLAWYDRHRRHLPWRARPGEAADPYAVWLSEIMLQQTTVATVIPYFRAFLTRWPTVTDLAAADLDAVLHAWQGLGYYARARNLHRCAGVVTEDLGGRFPDTEARLLALPGIGPYTAAAITAIAFGRRSAPVDGNIVRVISRLDALDRPQPGLKDDVGRTVAKLVPTRRPGDFVQAMMDLGATVCLPRNPDCAACPWGTACVARAQGRAADLPIPAPKRKKPRLRGVAFWLTRADGSVLLRRRPERGLLGGMMEVPSTPWREDTWSPAQARAEAPAPATWHPLPGAVRHTFTHFHLELTVWTGRVATARAPNGTWCAPTALGDHALPTVMRKVCDHALADIA